MYMRRTTIIILLLFTNDIETRFAQKSTLCVIALGLHYYHNYIMMKFVILHLKESFYAFFMLQCVTFRILSFRRQRIILIDIII